jgi:hypothetical protein
MAKQRFQPNPTEVAAPIIPEETREEQQARLKRVTEGIQKLLQENRAVITVNNLRLIDGRVVPEVQVQITK